MVVRIPLKMLRNLLRTYYAGNSLNFAQKFAQPFTSEKLNCSIKFGNRWCDSVLFRLTRSIWKQSPTLAFLILLKRPDKHIATKKIQKNFYLNTVTIQFFTMKLQYLYIKSMTRMRKRVSPFQHFGSYFIFFEEKQGNSITWNQSIIFGKRRWKLKEVFTKLRWLVFRKTK